MFRNLDRVKMSYGIVCFNAEISYAFDSICNSKFVCAEGPSDTFFELLKKMIPAKFQKIKYQTITFRMTTLILIHEVIPTKQRL
jgi:hypothetical protein